MNQSGGIFYHYLAARNSVRNWANYKNDIDLFLQEEGVFSGPSNAWIGVSGGYSLPREKLRMRLKDDIFWDMDPLAEVIFRLRFGKPNHWRSDSAFVVESDPMLSAEKTAKKLNELDVSNIIFCNVLGQLSLVFPAKDEIYWSTYLDKLLLSINKNVISFHDLFTLKAKSKVLNEIDKKPVNRKMESSDVLVSWLKESSICSIELGLVDHLTTKLPFDRQLYSWWRKDSKSLHLIDCISLRKT